jgi:antitoxin component YwqK of YwqJK toxin-antitoxin module
MTTDTDLYENGQKKSEGSSTHGVKNGTWTWWYENGNKELEKKFKDNELDGLSTTWNENGEKIAEQNFKKGRTKGDYIKFDTEIFNGGRIEDSVVTEIKTKTDFNGNLSSSHIREIAVREYDQHDLRNEIDGGRGILNIEEELTQYQYSYGKMVRNQWKIILKEYYGNRSFNDGVQIIDYGCGQGGASLCFLDKFYKAYKKNISKIKLIDAGSLALQQGKMFLENYSSDIQIVAINKELDDLETKDLETDQNLWKIHLFSNVLDIKNFKITGLVSKLLESIKKSKGKHSLIAISYDLADPTESQRLGEIYDLFINTKYDDLKINRHKFFQPFNFQDDYYAIGFRIDLTVPE